MSRSLTSTDMSHKTGTTHPISIYVYNNENNVINHEYMSILNTDFYLINIVSRHLNKHILDSGSWVHE